MNCACIILYLYVVNFKYILFGNKFIAIHAIIFVLNIKVNLIFVLKKNQISGQ